MIVLAPCSYQRLNNNSILMTKSRFSKNKQHKLYKTLCEFRPHGHLECCRDAMDLMPQSRGSDPASTVPLVPKQAALGGVLTCFV